MGHYTFRLLFGFSCGYLLFGPSCVYSVLCLSRYTKRWFLSLSPLPELGHVLV